MAIDYCTRELKDGKDLNIAKFAKCWVAVSMEGEEYKEILGFMGFVWRIDLPVFRVTGDRTDRTTSLMAGRLHAFFQDQGARGTELFIHISSKERPEQRCGKWAESLAAEGAVPADRFAVKI